MTFDAERFISGLHEFIGRALKPHADRLKAVEERLAALEADDLGRRVAQLLNEENEP